MEIDKVRIIITIINFGILLLILRHFFFNRINDTLTTRQNDIDTRIKSAEENEQKAQTDRLEAEKNLNDSKNQGRSIVENYKVKAEKLSEEIVNDAHKDAQEIMDRAAKEAQREKEKAEAELKKQVIDIAVMLSSKAMEKAIDENEHRRLINEFISKVGI